MLFFLIPDFQNDDERYEWLMAHLTSENINALRREALYITRNREDAQDVMMDSMLIGIKKCHQLKNEDRVFSWLFTIVHRAAIKKRKSCPNDNLYKSEIDIRINRPDIMEQVDSRLEKESERETVLSLLNQLKSPAKEIVLLHTQDEMDFHEIAARLRMNYHTVRSRFNRTMRDMRREMEKMNHE